MTSIRKILAAAALTLACQGPGASSRATAQTSMTQPHGEQMSPRDAQVASWLFGALGITEGSETVTMAMPMCTVTITADPLTNCRLGYEERQISLDGAKAEVLWQLITNYEPPLVNDGASVARASSISCSVPSHEDPVCHIEPVDGGGSSSFEN